MDGSLPITGSSSIRFGRNKTCSKTTEGRTEAPRAHDREAGRAQLGAIASLWDDSFRLKQLANPQGIQRRINALRQKNETLHKLSVSWHDPGGGTWLVQSGHEHDPDGTKQDVTGAVTRGESLANPAPIDERNFTYHEVRATDGAHYAELNYPLRRFRAGRREIVGALELHYDLKQLDAALTADKRTLTMASALAALTAAVLISLLLSRAVLSPLDRLPCGPRLGGSAEVRWRPASTGSVGTRSERSRATSTAWPPSSMPPTATSRSSR